MRPDFRNGFTVHKDGGDFVFVSPHSGPALETPTARDEYSETVASLCWKKLGGTLIVSNVTRKRMWGIDFNRMKPPKDLAIKYFPLFEKDREEDREKLYDYRKKYAWVAVNEKDHRHREKIFDGFWHTVRNSGRLNVFLHRKFMRPKNFPMVMDIVNFQGKGVDTPIVKKIIENINEEYKEFFESIKNLYLSEVMVEERRIIKRMKKVFGDFSLEKAGMEYKEHLKSDLKFIKKYADKDLVKKLDDRFNQTNFLKATKSGLKNAKTPYVSLNKIFGGGLAFGPATELEMGDRIILEIELNQFIGRFFPEEASDIVNSLVDKLRKIEKYKIMGMGQTEIIKFI